MDLTSLLWLFILGARVKQEHVRLVSSPDRHARSRRVTVVIVGIRLSENFFVKDARIYITATRPVRIDQCKLSSLTKMTAAHSLALAHEQ